MGLFELNIKRMQERGDIQGLIDLLAHRKPSIRLTALEALFKLREVDGLGKALQNDLSSVRSKAVSMLGDINIPETTRLLCEFMLLEAEEGVWQQAFDILAARISNADEWISMGLRLLKEQQVERGIKCFDMTARLKASKEQIGIVAGTLLEMGRPREALVYFDRYIALAGDDDHGWVGKGWCLAQIGELIGALECANKAISINFANIWARELAAMVYLENKEYDRVCAMERDTVRLDPNYIRAYITWSEALSRLGKLDDAIEVLEKATQLHQQEWLKPEDVQNVHLQLGLVHARKGEIEPALSHFGKARTALNDDHSRAMEEGYKILTYLGLALQGMPEERAARLLTISAMRESKAYKDVGEKLVAEGSVEDCISNDWLLHNPVYIVTAILKWWPLQEIEQLIHALTRAGIQMFKETVDKAIADFSQSSTAGV